MAKVTVRKETGKLVIDFTYRGVRCREQTALVDTTANRKRAEIALKRMREAISSGMFIYADFFPGSPLATRFDEVGLQQAGTRETNVPSRDGGHKGTAAAPRSPSFREFICLWKAELLTPTEI